MTINYEYDKANFDVSKMSVEEAKKRLRAMGFPVDSWEPPEGDKDKVIETLPTFKKQALLLDKLTSQRIGLDRGNRMSFFRRIVGAVDCRLMDVELAHTPDQFSPRLLRQCPKDLIVFLRPRPARLDNVLEFLQPFNRRPLLLCGLRAEEVLMQGGYVYRLRCGR